MNLSTMLQRTITLLVLISNLLAQDYAWPIQASRSLSATFCEYRKGHLHAGIDIKTWGEMEVPCLAIEDGYIEKVIVHYNGYGRGLFLRTNHGHVAVYGHMELFPPEIEELVKARQQERDQYQVRLTFQPQEFPVRKGQSLGVSGTSGTEHPHLHFEIRDTAGVVLNPQLFYAGIKDTRSPVLDEILLQPATPESRINGSRQFQIVDPGESADPILVQGPFTVSVNAHDRSDGTYNKYSIFEAELFLNDSLAFQQRFESLPLSLSDNVSLIYPGTRGKRGWRFMALYEDMDSSQMPFATSGLHGNLNPTGLASLRIRVADIKGNDKATEILVREHAASKWEILREHGQYVIIRQYTPNGYERYQFFSGNNQFIPITQTLHTLSTTRWYLPEGQYSTGVRGLGALNGEIKWIIPPEGQLDSLLTLQWHQIDGAYYYRIQSSEPSIFPISYELEHRDGKFFGELTQIGEDLAESDLVPLSVMATSSSLRLKTVDDLNSTLDLKTLKVLEPFQSCAMELDNLGFRLNATNSGANPLYIQCDTIRSEFSGSEIVGAGIRIMGDDADFSGLLQFIKPDTSGNYGFYEPQPKKSWKYINALDSAGVLSLALSRSGEIFVLKDNDPPTVDFISKAEVIRPGQRMVFKIADNTGKLPRPGRSLTATLDGAKFFPDFNPLRDELSFHVPHAFARGDHEFTLKVTDAAGNIRQFKHSFRVN